MTDKTPELLPCPFCGGNPIMKKRKTIIVECDGCGALQITRIENNPVEKWNTRQAATAQSEQEIVALRNKCAEQQAAAYTIRAVLAGDNDDLAKCATDAIRHLDKHFKGKSEELTRLITEAEHRGAVKALREASDMYFDYTQEESGSATGKSCAAELSRMADELEGRKV